MNRAKLIVIVGPTGVGKTPAAIRLAEHYKTEVVSADSRQVFREMEIGTAKPSEEEMRRVKHHFINCRSIEEGYDAGTYGNDARKVLERLFGRHELVILCGGSGLYIKALLEGFDDLPPVSEETRKGVVKAYQQEGLRWLQNEVEKMDPDYFEAVDRQNPQRLMRALEVIRSTGRTFSGYHRKEMIQLPYSVIKIGLTLEPKTLYQRIDQRADDMISRGLVEEAKRHFSKRQLPALQTVGYQEIFGFLEGGYDRDEAIRLLKRNTRHYAKRQFTWFRKEKEIRWLSPDDWEGILSVSEQSAPA